MRFLPDLPMFRAFILSTSSGPTPKMDSAESPTGFLVGHTGSAVTDLRPAGKAKISDKIHSVVTRGEFIEAGSLVQVVEVGSFRTVVEKIDKEA
jgi:membrane-bound serine protease (ClpP class)